jgi:transcriptional regulator with XRE-family HTH domain
MKAEENVETFGGFVRGLRQARRLTLGQMALRSGLGKATLSRWESGAAFPRIPELRRALDALDAAPSDRTRSLRLLDAPRAILAHRADACSPLSLGDLLHGLRQRSGKTKTDIARAVGVSRTLYYQWESDAGQPSHSQLHAVCFALGASAEETAALCSGTLSDRPAQKSRDVLLHLLNDWMAWDDGVTESLYTLHLLSLLASLGRLVKQNKADPGDMALVLNKYGSCVETWHNDVGRRDHYYKRALALADHAREPLHFHLVNAVRSRLLPPPNSAMPPSGSLSVRVNRAFAWQARFATPSGQAYLLMFIAGAMAETAPEESLRLADTYCALVEGDADEYPCRLRDRGTLLYKCGRYAESVNFLSRLVPQDEYRAGLKQIDMAKGLIALGAKAEARTCLDEGRRTAAGTGFAFLHDQIADMEHTLA